MRAEPNRAHVGILVAFRAFYSLGFFEIFDLLHHIKPINLLVFIVLINCFIYGVIHRPWRHKISPEIKRPLLVKGFM